MNADISRLRQQLRQLQSLHEEGALGADAYQSSRTTLERKLLDALLGGEADAPEPAPAPPRAARPSRGLLIAAAAAVLVLAALGYRWTGTPGLALGTAERPAVAQADAAASSPHAMSFEQIAQMATRLAERLKENPQDAEGWAMLARSYAVLGRRAEAVPAYERAVALNGQDAGLLADYADALAVTRETRLAGEPLALVERALKLDPDHLKALSLAGTAAFERQDYAAAVARWERILSVAPADSPYVGQVRGSIAQARELGHLPAAPAPVAAASGPALGVSGRVTLAPALAAQARPGDTVFVFARAAEGPRMPLAILRKQVKDLPLSFRLDDSLAMSPSAKLSAYPKVVVGARISRSGEAMPQPGDLIGHSGVVALGASDLRIEISESQ